LISLVIITRNEADRVGRCIASATCADECVVVDSGSTDETVSVARSAGAKVVETDWPGFVEQKNRALAMARGEWTVSLDADETLDDEAVAALQDAITQGVDASGFSFRRRTRWLGYSLRFGRFGNERKVRVVRRGCGRWVGVNPHDRLEVRGEVRRLRGTIWHTPYRNRAEHLSTIERYSWISAQQLVAAGAQATWWHLWIRPSWSFLYAYIVRLGFLDGRPGLEVAWLGARYVHKKWHRVRTLRGS